MTATKPATEVKVTLNRTELSRKLEFVGLATEKKSTIPILATVKLSLTGKLLKMVATNLDIAAEVSMQCVSDAMAELCVDFKKLSALVKQKPGEEVELVFSGTKLGINAGRSKSTLSGVDVAGFPEVERKENEGESIALPAAVMCEALKATAWASSADESRYTLSCVQMTITPDSLRCEATDSKALAIATAPIVAPGKDVKVTIPVSSIPSILGVLAESKTEAFVTLSDKSFLIESGVYSISTRLLAGQFPAVAMIENSKFAEVCTVNADELSAAIGRLMVMGQESKVDKANPILFNVSNDCLALSVPASEIGDGNECVSADMVGTMNGKLNGIFVREGIAPCQSRMIEVASVEGADCTNAFRVKSSWPIAENAKLDYTFIVAGMRL